MKYAQLFMGLLIGVAVGGSVVASTGKGTAGSGAVDEEGVKRIVRQVIEEEPQLIMASVQKYQEKEAGRQSEKAGEALKDKAVRDEVYNDKNVGSVGPKDSKRVVVEFFDYNCPACKMQYKEIDKLVKADKTVRVLFREYPIFGPSSEQNSMIGIAITRLAPEKYFDFYEKMHAHNGRAGQAEVERFIKELGLDVEAVKTEARKPEVAAILEQNRVLGEKLGIQGTPTLVIGDEVILHAAEAGDIARRLK